MMVERRLKFCLGASVLIVTFFGCLNDVEEVDTRNHLECLLSVYNTFHGIQVGDTLVLQDMAGWTDTTSVISLRKFKNGRSLDGQPDIMIADYAGVVILGLFGHLGDQSSVIDALPNPTIVNGLTWREYNSQRNFLQLPSVPERFSELQLIYSRRRGIVGFLLGESELRKELMRCNL